MAGCVERLAWTDVHHHSGATAVGLADRGCTDNGWPWGTVLRGAIFACQPIVANVLGIDLTQIARTLGSDATGQAPASHAVDPRNTAFGRELYSTMVRNARAERPTRSDVPSTRTPLSGTQAASALQSAYCRLFGEPPTNDTLSVLVAQWAHETGGGASMLNYNFGVLKGVSPAGLSTAYTTHEGSGASTQKVVAHFRAYETAADGATDYLRLLSQRFPSALDAAHRGDAPGFVHALKKSGYFTDSESSYTHSVCALAEQVRTHGYNDIGPASRVSHADSTVQSVASRVVSPVHQTPASVVGQNVGSVLGAGQTARTVDVSAMGDELARAALRIAAGENHEEDG